MEKGTSKCLPKHKEVKTSKKSHVELSEVLGESDVSYSFLSSVVLYEVVGSCDFDLLDWSLNGLLYRS